MAVIKPFPCIRPDVKVADRVAALPYDVYNRQEACAEVAREPLSFLRIDRAETQFGDDVDTYDDCVYEKARELLDNDIASGILIEDQSESYYLYELTMNGRAQTGIVACASIDDYESGVIKKHENTRADKEIDRIRHVERCNAQTGPIFLAYRSQKEINDIVRKVKEGAPLYDFTAPDGIRHTVWKIAEGSFVKELEAAFAMIPNIYIADGHHRAASAVKAGLKRRTEKPDFCGDEPFNYFLSVLFPDDQLMIMDYNRVIKDLNGYTSEQFLQKVSEAFEVEKAVSAPYAPEHKGEFGMYLDGCWYKLCLKAAPLLDDPVRNLDVSLLQDYLLGPVLGIGDPRTDSRIDFVGGIRGLSELERRVEEGMAVAFAMFPTSIQELFAVADASLLMPPKSTWFEPKLRSGLFIHRLG